MDKNDKEIMKEQIEQFADAQKLIMENADLFKIGARICKKSFNALLEVGFGRDDAIRIVAGGGMNTGKVICVIK